MDQCYAISLRNRIQLGNKLGPFSKCKSILQEISWIIENWEDTVRGCCLDSGIHEISGAENALYDAKRKLWRLCMSLSAKVESQRKHNEKENGYNERSHIRVDYPPSEGSSTRVLQNVNKEVVLRENTAMPIAFHQLEARKQTFLIKNSPGQPPLKNLLLDWSVFLDANGQLCLQGNMPTEGEWVTSPIAVRVGETVVKTSSGTVYNVYGPMVVPSDENIPEFVQEKFHSGFPVDWKAVVNKWIATVKQNENNNLQAIESHKRESSSDPYVLLHDIKKKSVPTPRDITQQKETVEMPPPKARPMRLKNIGLPQQELQNPSPEQVIPEKMSSTMDMGLAKNLRRKGEVPNSVPRFSKRILSKSLVDNSADGVNPNMNESVTNEEDVKLLKMWRAEFSEECNGMILKGDLINKNADILDKNYTTNPVCRRLHSELVETEDGQYYRLVGPSSSVFSENKDFDYGFPANWKNLLEKLQASRSSNASKTSHTLNKRRVSIAQQSNASRCEPINNTTTSVASAKDKKRQSVMIQQLIKHHISQGQNTLEERNNGSLLARKGNTAAAKRKVEAAPFVPENFIPIKKKRSKATDEAELSMNEHDESLGNISDMTEYQWKQQIKKNFQSGRSKVAEPVRSLSKEDQGQPVKGDAVKRNDSKKPESKSKANATDKYVLGLATDDCDSEFDFNIF